MAENVTSPVEAKLLLVLESIELALSGQGGQARGAGSPFPSLDSSKSVASTGVEGLTRLAGTLTFHFERLVGSMASFRQAVNMTFDRLHDPMRTTHGHTASTTLDRVSSRQSMSGQSSSVTFDRSMSRQWDLSGMPGGPGSGGAGARPGQPGQPPARSLRVTTGDHESKFDTVMQALRASVGTHSNQFQTTAQTIHTSGQKQAAASALAASKFATAASAMGVAVIAFANVTGSFIKVLDSSVKVGAPDAWATLNKSFQLVMATLGSELVPLVAQFAHWLQQLVRDWNALDKGTRESVVSILMMVSGINLLVYSVQGLLAVIKAFSMESKGVVAGHGVGSGVQKLPGDTSRAAFMALSGGIPQPNQEAIDRFNNRWGKPLGPAARPGWRRELAVPVPPQTVSGSAGVPASKVPLAVGAPVEKGSTVERWMESLKRVLNKGVTGEGGPVDAVVGDKAKAVAVRSGEVLSDSYRSALGMIRGAPGNQKTAPLTMAFQDRANPQFMGFDQAWRSIQANLLKGDDLDRQIFEIQQKMLDETLKIAANTEVIAKKPDGVKVKN